MDRYENILIPMDFSDTSKVAIRRALKGEHLQADKVTVVHIVDYMPPAFMRPEIPATYASEELMKQRVQEHLLEFINQAGLVGCKSIVQFGHAKTRLLAFLKEQKFDLVVLAKHKRSGIENWLGSVSNAIASEATCDVLIVHD